MAAIDPDRRNRHPRMLTEAERERVEEFIDQIHYSSRYSDNEYEYRHVQLPKDMIKRMPKDYFDPSKGWEHYEVHEPEPHILLFKRPINYQPPTVSH
ncbi:MAG: hypothetical protein Q9210_005257 [Variospora velana]